MMPVTMVDIAPQRNQNSASGRMNLPTPGFSSAGILGMVGVCTKLKYHSRPIHMMALRTWNQRKANTHQANVTISFMAFPPDRSSRDDVNQDDDHGGQDESQQHRLAQRIQWIFHAFPPAAESIGCPIIA